MRYVKYLIKYFLMTISVLAMLIYFSLATFFVVASINAVTQVSFIQFVTMLAFCVVFMIAGGSYMHIADLLCVSIRRH